MLILQNNQVQVQSLLILFYEIIHRSRETGIYKHD